MTRPRWTRVDPIPMTSVLIRKPCEDTERPQEGHVKMEAEMAMMCQQVEDCQRWLAATRRQERRMERFLLRAYSTNQPY